MRVHLVTDCLCTGGGLEHIFQVARGLPDIRFTVFGKPGNAAHRFESLKNVEICGDGYKPALVLQRKPDLVHIHHLKPLLAFYSNPYRQYKVPILFTAHGLHIHKYEFMPGPVARLKYNLRFFLEKRLLKRADGIIAVSREDRVFMESRYGLTDVVYLTNGIDTAGIEPKTLSRNELRSKLNFPPDAFLFLTVARFDFQKGYDILLKAIHVLRNFLENRNVSFISVGGGDTFGEMRKMAAQLSISSYLNFLGERRDVYDIIQAADVFLLPSRWEGLPIVLLEAGLLETPVLASSTYGNREIIGQTNGILFDNLNVSDLAAKIKGVVNGDYDLAAHAAGLAAEVRHHYNLDNMLAGLHRLYRSLTD